MENQSEYSSISVIKIINEIEKDKYVLPSMQRDYVWEKDRILGLFDSIIKGYPINSFLFWKISYNNIGGSLFYKILSEMQYLKGKKPIKPSFEKPIDGYNLEENCLAVLDGQQRLTSLNLSLKGHVIEEMKKEILDFYANKNNWNKVTIDIHKKKKIKKYFCINLLTPKNLDNDYKYEMDFLSDDEIKYYKEVKNNSFWFPVKDIFILQNRINSNNEGKSPNVRTYLKETGLIFAEETRDLLKDSIEVLYDSLVTKKIINYYEINSQNFEDVLEIFKRINSQGVHLKTSDLILSTIDTFWKNKNIKLEIDEILAEINTEQNGFVFDKDFILINALTLIDEEPKFSLKAFSEENIIIIEENWDLIKNAIITGCNLIYDLGYTKKHLTSSFVLIPVIYYIYHNDLTESYFSNISNHPDIKKIEKFVIHSLLKQMVGGKNGERFIKPIRDVIGKNIKKGSFPVESIFDIDMYGGEKSFYFTDEEIDSLLEDAPKNLYFSIFKLILPNFYLKKNDFELDHFFPDSKLKSKKTFIELNLTEDDFTWAKERKDKIFNFIILDKTSNIVKSNDSPQFFLDLYFPDETSKQSFITNNALPNNVKFTYSNFKTFYEQRKLIFKNVLNSHLKK